MGLDMNFIFLKNGIIPIMTVVIGFIVAIGSALGYIPSDLLPAATLTVISMLATTEIIDRNVKLNEMHNNIRQLEKLTRKELGNTVKLSPDACYDRIKEEIENASTSIQWMSPQSRKGTRGDINRVYEIAIDTILKNGKVRLTWVTRIDNEARRKRKQRITNIVKNPAKLSIKEIPHDYPGDIALSFIIFDNETLVTRSPFMEGLEGSYIISKDPIMVQMFIEYFNYIATKTLAE